MRRATLFTQGNDADTWLSKMRSHQRANDVTRTMQCVTQLLALGECRRCQGDGEPRPGDMIVTQESATVGALTYVHRPIEYKRAIVCCDCEGSGLLEHVHPAALRSAVAWSLSQLDLVPRTHIQGKGGLSYRVNVLLCRDASVALSAGEQPFLYSSEPLSPLPGHALLMYCSAIYSMHRGRWLVLMCNMWRNLNLPGVQVGHWRDTSGSIDRLRVQWRPRTTHLTTQAKMNIDGTITCGNFCPPLRRI